MLVYDIPKIDTQNFIYLVVNFSNEHKEELRKAFDIVNHTLYSCWILVS